MRAREYGIDAGIVEKTASRVCRWVLLLGRNYGRRQSAHSYSFVIAARGRQMAGASPKSARCGWRIW